MAFARVVGPMLKRAPRQALLRATLSIDELLYEVAWGAVEQAAAVPAAMGCWLLLGEDDRVAALSVSPSIGLAEAAARALPVAGVAWLAGAVGAPNPGTADAVVSLMSGLSQALLGAGLSLPWGPAVVTEAVLVTAGGEDTAPLAAALWRLGRLLQSEQPTLRTRLIDVEAANGWPRV